MIEKAGRALRVVAGPDRTAETVAAELRDRILSGRLPAGAKLPSESEWAAEGVGRTMWRAALAELRTEGLVGVRRGSGAYVRRTSARPTWTGEQAVLTRKNGKSAVTHICLATSGYTTDGEPVNSTVDAWPDLALDLGLTEGAPVFVREQRLVRDDRPMLHRLYLPHRVCADIPALALDPFRDPADLYDELTAAGNRLVWTERIRARMPLRVEAEQLAITDTTPILITHRTTLDQTDRVLAVEETRRNADDAELAYTLTARPSR